MNLIVTKSSITQDRGVNVNPRGLNKNIVSIIPAIVGSEGQPDKNVLDVSGKPLVGWTIEQSLNL